MESSRVNEAGHAERSGDFIPLFGRLGIVFSTKGREPQKIDNNKVLKWEGISLKLYFNEARGGHAPYFAANPDLYAAYDWQGWEDVHGEKSQKEKNAGYFLKMPVAGREEEALRSLLRHVSAVGITGIEIANFKGIGEAAVRIPLRPITLLFGANSAGKSTIVQAMYYAREVLGNGDPDPGKATLGGGSIDLGGFRALVHKHDLDREIRLRFHMRLVPGLLGTESYSAWDHPDGGQERTDVNEVVSIESAWVEFQTIYDVDWRFIVERYGVGVNGQPLATIGQDSYFTGTFVSELNAEHPLFHAMDGLFGEDGRRGEGWYGAFREAIDRHIIDVGGGRRSFTIWMDEEVTPLPVWGRPYALAEDCEFKAKVNECPVLAQFWALLNQLLICPGELLLREFGKVRHLGPIREIPPRAYTPSRTPDPSRWTTGLAAWDLLMGSAWVETGLLNVGQRYSENDSCSVGEVSTWLSSPARLDLGYSMSVEDCFPLPADGKIMEAIRRLGSGSGDSSKETVRAQILGPLEELPVRRELKITDLKRKTDVPPCDIGVGVSQVVPVIVGVLDNSRNTFVVEQPELHLHPAAQCRLGDLFIEEVNKNPTRLFLIETHSEHLILRLLRRIRETTENELPPGAPELRPEQVGVYYIEGGEQGMKLTGIPIAPDGDFTTQWPRGFFEERAGELF